MHRRRKCNHWHKRNWTLKSYVRLGSAFTNWRLLKNGNRLQLQHLRTSSRKGINHIRPRTSRGDDSGTKCISSAQGLDLEFGWKA
ncbi:unnamed protein product [Brassica oleracea]|nr:hypothetical protein Bca52824_078011 [Brassica carinata]